MDNIKVFEPELKFIDKLVSLSKFKIELVENKEIDAFLIRKTETFLLQTNARHIEGKDKNLELSFILDGAIYKTKKFGCTSTHTKLKADKTVDVETTIELNGFQSENFKQYGLYKTFFQTELNEINTFHREFETVTHQRNGEKYFYDCIRIQLNNKTYDVTQLKYKDKGFYVFECLQKQGYDEFSKVCFSIQQAIGFINKLMVGGEEFTFDEIGNCYYSNYIRPAMKGMYSPITTNPYYYSDIEKSVAEFYLNKLTRISSTNFSNLVYKIHTEPEFSVVILAILEATSIRSLLIVPSIFAVIVEQLTKHLSIKETGLEKPINDKILTNKIINELHKVIDVNSETLSASNILKLKRRLNEINKL